MRDLWAAGPDAEAVHLPPRRLAVALAMRHQVRVAPLLGMQARWPVHPARPRGASEGQPTRTMGSGFRGTRSQVLCPG